MDHNGVDQRSFAAGALSHEWGDALPNDQITIDELFARQSQPDRLLVTIEALPDDDERVTVTPYLAGVGCLCSHALTVLKSTIESVTTTEQVHACCGKRLLVVEVAFADATLADVFQQVAEGVRQSARRRPAPFAPASMTQPIPSGPLVMPNLGRINPFANWYAPTLRPRFDRPLALSNEAIGSYEEGYGGLTTSQVLHLVFHDFQCNSQRLACEETCYMLYGDDDTQRGICLCECNNDYRQCVHPSFRRTPCL